jgi:uncharacterized protein
MPEFIKFLSGLVNGDPRVRVDFQPIWGDPGEVPVSMCMGKERQATQLDFFREAKRAGLRLAQVTEAFTPGGYVCYAAKANSLVIRSDGSLNKCTVALENEKNRVGRVLEDGTLDIDIDKFTLWTGSGLEQDQTCQTCFMAPCCQGNACPLERLENHHRPCPSPKHYADQWIPLLSKEGELQTVNT